MLKKVIRYAAPFVRVSSLFRYRCRVSRRRNETFFIFDGRHYTYVETYRRALQYAHLFHAVKQERVACGELSKDAQLPVGIYMENRPEFLFALFGAALTGDVLFANNTGFRGEVLANVIGDSGQQLLLTEMELLPRINQILPDLPALERARVAVVDTPSGELDCGTAVSELLAWSKQQTDLRPDRPPPSRIVNTDAFIVIYTSGTTGRPKGVVCSQVKLIGAGLVVKRRAGLTADDRGYVAMPLFHSNAHYLGMMPLLLAGGSFVLKRKFSASAFEEDILKYGCTCMNYVGQPIHYILAALEKKHGPEKVAGALANHPNNRFRLAIGNGATVVDRKKFKKYLGMEHVFELYGSSEAAISTFNVPGDPPESLGQVKKKIMVLNEDDEPCAPGVVVDGRLTNYDEAVGEIVRKLGSSNIFFDGYHHNNSATESKYRDGFYRSGDLGHIRIHNGQRHLYFNGRTDDWIRKDGENFSAENVSEIVLRHPDVELAVAFGVPGEVSDEKVMAVVQQREGTAFDPQGVFDFFAEEQSSGGMDPKWFPDYVRVVDQFDMTATQKISVRPLKRQHFNLKKHPDLVVYFRQRGDTAFKQLTLDHFESLEQLFVKAGREQMLENY